ncbi:unnamed protein product [Peronospora belbahrii]|uniref:RPA-interacting protein C-terminal domain-containing protein n=1 Tax=Peronospora belbahrii TaxID=622444 RepID=A0AAU9KGK9_9STRA|nr:unnamed protein product [Peronospora belbahrii]CAH0515740.1 unnamed protein product [Peronospora belbahrii]
MASPSPFSTHRLSCKRLSLSPPVWKDQLRQRCLQRLKRDRVQILAKIRHLSACTSVTEEMQRLVAHEQHISSCASIDDLLLLGKMKESEYLEIIHALEDALKQDEEEEELQHMADLEDAELEAMLAGMDLDDERKEQGKLSESGCRDLQDLMTQDISVLCPQCKAGYLREKTLKGATIPYIACSCGFTFHVKNVNYGVLKDFQEKIVNAFMTHRDSCFADPTFEKEKESRKDGVDTMCIKCTHCGCDDVLS